MGGLQRFFIRITPIIMLICFICFGISYSFEAAGSNQQLTYLTHETITIDDNNTQNDTTDDITIDSYNFDWTSYRENINVDILKRSTTNVINIQAYEDTWNTFNILWENGYQFGDGVKTIINVAILIVNTLILPINVFLTPLRIIAGIILTSLTIVGINIGRQTPIITMLNGILDNLTIPMIKPTFNKTEITQYYNTTWYAGETVSFGTSRITQLVMDIEFKDGLNRTYNKIGVFKHSGVNNYQVVYYTSNDEFNAYDKTNGWTNEYYRTITITANNSLTNTDINKLQGILNALDANEIETPEFPSQTTTWQFNTTISGIPSSTYNITFVSNNITFNSIQFEGSRTVIYTGENNTIYVYNTYANIGQWVNDAYRTITITDNSSLSTQQLSELNNILINNATQIT